MIIVTLIRSFALVTSTLVFGLPQYASAQTGSVIEEITVTARKRAENLQDVPDSITAFSAATIERSGIEDIRDFFDRVPNLTFQDRSTYRKETSD